MLDPFLLELLVCPESKTALALAPPEIVLAVNAAIEKGTLTERSGRRVSEKVQTVLVRLDNEVAYPVRGDMPFMRLDDQISLRQIR